VDYSQIELRILAHYSRDESLRNAFHEGQDIHRATAAKVFSVTPDEVNSDQRRFAKSVNFGLMYGMGAFRLARDTDLTLADAEDFIEAYFNNFPGVRDFLETTKDLAGQNGYVETLYGRRRYFPDLAREGGNKQHRQRAEREAINTPIQGTAADIMKKAMIEVDDRLQADKFKARMLLQVHDELVIEAPEDEIDAVQQMVVETMEAAADILDIPVVAEAHFGPNWAEMA
jgi:DNA polymerase-1